jgi:hypothetical protein
MPMIIGLWVLGLQGALQSFVLSLEKSFRSVDRNMLGVI